jgi:predicted nucleotidyltransferase component of viral defense system
MLPRADIIAWRSEAPWAFDDDVEQDLIVTRALLDLFSDGFLAERLAFRGGTALHRLYLAPAARYSEDIDLVQRVPEGIGRTFDRIRERLQWLGRPKREVGEIPKLWFPFETEGGARRRLKIEINTREHFAGVMLRTFAVDHRAAAGSVEVPTHSIDELLATKLRAYTQRDKGRDLFDLWWASEHETVDLAEVVRLYGVYVTHQGGTADSAPELRAKTLAKIERGIFAEVRPMLRSGIEFDTTAALEWFEARIISRLRNDDGTRIFGRSGGRRDR